MTKASAQKQNGLNILTLIVLTILHTYFYIFMEWVFFATKPSPISLGLAETTQIFFVSGGVAVAASLLVLFVLALPAIIFKDMRLFLVACFAPAFIFSINALILIDNFTYTLFKFGVVSTQNLWRIFYALGFIAFLLWQMKKMHQGIYNKKKPSLLPAFGLLAVSLVFTIPVILSNVNSRNSESEIVAAKRPNVLIIGGDGLSASYLSLYGAARDTTPFLKQMSKEALLAKNAFVNVSSTTASTTSMLTGREPITVQVFRYPDILSEDASYQHLPNILKMSGYKTAEIGTPDYVDAQKLNLLSGFDMVNGLSISKPVLNVLPNVLGNSRAVFFISTIVERASDRLLHIFYVRDMRNPFEEVNNPNERLTDEQRVEQILDLFDHAKQPLFVFVHMMNTHGPQFSSGNMDSVSESTSEAEWDKNRYQEAIVSFDENIKLIYNHLSSTGQLDNTIIVVYTDHGFMYSISQRVPLLMRFPHSQYAGVRKNNIQVIDVAATLLDYLEIKKPSWMTGASFLTEEIPPDRRIVSITASSPKKIKPPFAQIKSVQFIVCQKWYSLNVQDNIFSSGTVSGHTSLCNASLLPSEADAHRGIIDYLKQYNYDTSSLQ